MAEVFDVYDNEALIGAIPISPQQRAQLQTGASITITYHTPRMLRQTIAARNGMFDVVVANNRLIVSNPEAVKQYIEMQLDIARAMKQPDKWTDPDAEGNNPIR